MNSEEIHQYIKKNYYSDSPDEPAKISIFEFPGSIEEFKYILTSILQKKSLNEYVIAQDTEIENTLVMLRMGDLQQLGIFICDFCGALSSSEEEKYIHQRAHYSF